MPDATAITNLLYRYAELIDLGDFKGVAELFRHARLKVGVEQAAYLDADAMLAMFERDVIRYPDGTPRTKHVTTNAIVEFGDDGTTATARSYYTVFQQVDDTPLQPIIAGRYHDAFELVDGAWRWSERDYSLVDLVGDLSRHLRMEIPR
jgi:3-phenylpropionate/cinnamic acid dioxygenase small subunit